MSKFTLKPKNIIVVGGGSGIGFAAAQKLLDNGAQNIILCSRNEAKLIDSAKKLILNDGQSVFHYPLDITNIVSHEFCFESIQNLIGKENPIDGLVISSGINFDGTNWKGFNVSENDFDKVMNTNLKGPFFLIRNFSNFLIRKNTKGNICVVSSISAHRDLISPYQISKNSLSGIVQCYGKYLPEKGIILNAVEPGPVSTDMMSYLEKYDNGKNNGISWPENGIHRTIRAEEIGEAICFLMSEYGDAYSGTCLLCGGGTKALFR